MSQLINYSRASSKYVDFVERGILLSQKLLRQGFESIKLRSSLKQFYGRHHELIGHYDKSVSEIISQWYSSSVKTTFHHYRTEQRNNMTSAIYGAGNAYPFGTKLINTLAYMNNMWQEGFIWNRIKKIKSSHPPHFFQKFGWKSTN